MKSHPFASCTTTVNVPAVLYDWPKKLNTSPGQIAASVIASGVCGYKLRVNVSVKSQPFASCTILVCTPAAVNVPPAHVNGRSSVQIVSLKSTSGVTG